MITLEEMVTDNATIKELRERNKELYNKLSEIGAITMVLLHFLGDSVIINQQDKNIRPLVEKITSGKVGISIELLDGEDVVQVSLEDVDEE